MGGNGRGNAGRPATPRFARLGLAWEPNCTEVGAAQQLAAHANLQPPTAKET